MTNTSFLVLTFLPILASSIASIVCFINSIKLPMFRGRFLLGTAISLAYTFANARWICHGMWEAVGEIARTEQVVWEIMEFAIFVVLLLFTRIPKDAGFK